MDFNNNDANQSILCKKYKPLLQDVVWNSGERTGYVATVCTVCSNFSVKFILFQKKGVIDRKSKADVYIKLRTELENSRVYVRNGSSFHNILVSRSVVLVYRAYLAGL